MGSLGGDGTQPPAGGGGTRGEQNEPAGWGWDRWPARRCVSRIPGRQKKGMMLRVLVHNVMPACADETES
jgi:hypothetical protein